eukprot:sb/3477724/
MGHPYKVVIPCRSPESGTRVYIGRLFQTFPFPSLSHPLPLSLWTENLSIGASRDYILLYIGILILSLSPFILLFHLLTPGAEYHMSRTQNQLMNSKWRSLLDTHEH